jgi:hypothetical protein
MFDVSLDGGLTWGKDRFVAAMPGGWDFAVSGISRANGMPVTACDAGASPYRGTIYVGWGDQRSDTSDSDVFLSRSTDGGETWSPALRVNDDLSGRHQFFPWMAVDQATGSLWFVFYDRRLTRGDTTEVWCARSNDGGRTFRNFRVSDSAFTPVADVFFGDYTNIAASGGKAYPIWMRMDARALSIWTAVVPDTIAAGVGELPAAPAVFTLEQNYPNPFNPATLLTCRLPEAGRARLEVHDLFGRPTGVYFSTLRAGARSVTRKMILVR